jgi:hypothetical protein
MASTATKVVLGIGCVMLLMFGTCAGCAAWFAHTASQSTSPSSNTEPFPGTGIPLPDPSTPAEDAAFKRVRSKDGIDLVVADQALCNDGSRLAGRAKNLCNAHKDELQCQVFIWPKASLVPKTLRVSDRQARAMVAYYVRSSNRQHECFRMLRDGHEEGGSGECGKTSVAVDEAVNAWDICKHKVLGLLRAPSTAEFVDDTAYHHVFLEKKTGNQVQLAIGIVGDWEFGFTNYIVQGEVDAQNAFGAKLRSPFECSVTRTKEDRWMVMKARILTR